MRLYVVFNIVSWFAKNYVSLVVWSDYQYTSLLGVTSLLISKYSIEY